MLQQIKVSILALLLMSVVTGVLYPLFMTAAGSLMFAKQSEGSLLTGNGGQVLGSELLSQSNTDPKWFWPRPSAGSFQTLPSGASNLAPTSKALQENISKQRAEWEKAGVKGAPPELLTSSGSGLDPHVSLEGALAQVSRICQARSWDESRCSGLKAQVEKQTEQPSLGFLGRERVNVNRLNLFLSQ